MALVTGASRGFGFAAARAFGAAGAQVVAVARTMGGLEELDDRITEAGGARAVLVPLDITDDPGMQRMAQALHARFARVDLWLHTAVFGPQLEPAAHILEKDLEKALAINVKAFQRAVRMIDPLLRLAPRGVALVAADPRTAEPFWGSYTASKAAQSAITQAWAAEAKRDYTVAEVVPPEMPTALRSKFFPGQDRQSLTSIDAAAETLMTALAQPIAPGSRITL
ncbi:MAG: SDR family NAD(P)-dependent oxidoreductase [Pseudomonadota bacterium]